MQVYLFGGRDLLSQSEDATNTLFKWDGESLQWERIDITPGTGTPSFLEKMVHFFKKYD
jgi:hypothetical protein